jgi:hypothetical protein
MRIGLIFAAFVPMAMCGCSGVIYQPFSLDTQPATSLSVDARQRFLLVTDKGGKLGNRRVTCAEPSPDVFAAIAASATASATVGQQSGQLAASLVERAAAVGPRTQTIQLLRDGLYRACEAYMNGIVDDEEYKRVLLGYDEVMITMLAIDGLTASNRPVPVLGAGTATATTGNQTASASGTAESATQPATGGPSPDAQFAAAVGEILKSYYSFQLDLKRLFLREPRGGGSQEGQGN